MIKMFSPMVSATERRINSLYSLKSQRFNVTYIDRLFFIHHSLQCNFWMWEKYHSTPIKMEKNRETLLFLWLGKASSTQDRWSLIFILGKAVAPYKVSFQWWMHNRHIGAACPLATRWGSLIYIHLFLVLLNVNVSTSLCIYHVKILHTSLQTALEAVQTLFTRRFIDWISIAIRCTRPWHYKVQVSAGEV